MPKSLLFKILIGLLAVIALWLLWGLAKKLFWFGLFVIVAYFVVKTFLKMRK
jgi:hypothetical protein